MPSSRVFLWIAALVVAAFAFFVPAVAEAQTMTFSTPPGDPIQKRPGPDAAPAVAGQPLVPHASDAFGINFDDCEKDILLPFGLTLDATATTSGDTIQVWAGTTADCSNDLNRSHPNLFCWPVTPQLTITSTAFIATLRGRDIAAQINLSQDQRNDTYAAAGEAACSAQTIPNPPPVTLYFLFLRGNTLASGTTPLKYTINVDTFGPAAPTVAGNAVTVGDKILYVSWSPPSAIAGVIGYKVYCSPRPNGAADAAPLPPIVDAGGSTCATPKSFVPRLNGPLDASDDSAADTGASSADTGAADTGTSLADTGTPAQTCADAGACSDSPFRDGMIGGRISADYFCGSTGAPTATSYKQPGLVNDVTYHFAVAAVDKLGNTGPIAVVGCNFPGAISDFWTQYRGAGGQAGGGCSVQSPPSEIEAPFGLAMFGMIFVGAAGAAVRRWRRR